MLSAWQRFCVRTSWPDRTRGLTGTPRSTPCPWRLGVFFPALIFGWLRERTGTIVPGTIFHALSNLTVLVLEASFFGPR